jgi:hypothetical protein
MMLKYGVIHPSHSVELLEKKKSNNLEKYGYDMFVVSPQGQIQRKLTWVAKYGVDSPQKFEKIKAKTKQTCAERYNGHFNQQHMVDILPLIEDYDWLFDQYITQNKTAGHIANELGISSTAIYNKLHSFEIAIKTTVGYSYSCIAWLSAIMEDTGIYIQHALNGGEYNIPETNWRADGYCQDTNTIYEFHGDYWHGNPDVYEPNIINKMIGKTMGELYQTTIDREQYITSNGYNLVVMWESNWRNIA